MKAKVFIDGKEGTTGLQIMQRLENRTDIELLKIREEERKDKEKRRTLLNEADIVFLCLPDQAAREAAEMVENPKTRIIDASTAHRTHPEWVYGFAEISKAQRKKISSAKKVANPGCHATGFIAITYPLIQMKILPENYPLSCCSVTGYSGGGKKMIEEYEAKNRDRCLAWPRQYGLELSHKHLPEMEALTGMKPVFSPIIMDYYAGMMTTVGLQNVFLERELSAEKLHRILEEYYQDEFFIRVLPFKGEGEIDPRGYADSSKNIGTNFLDILVGGNQEQTILTALFDNLGKGASGAAVQNMNLMLGLEESVGL